MFCSMLLRCFFVLFVFFFSSRRRHTRWNCDWSSDVCSSDLVIALGKLGSRELNYSSDIDLIFIYSDEGETSGSGTRGQISNREYFAKLAEHLVKLVGSESGEGAAYRVDVRLRPHGRLGPLAMSIDDTARYYKE